MIKDKDKIIEEKSYDNNIHENNEVFYLNEIYLFIKDKNKIDKSNKLIRLLILL
jgi:hypothetical protein